MIQKAPDWYSMLMKFGFLGFGTCHSRKPSAARGTVVSHVVVCASGGTCLARSGTPTLRTNTWMLGIHQRQKYSPSSKIVPHSGKKYHIPLAVVLCIFLHVTSICKAWMILAPNAFCPSSDVQPRENMGHHGFRHVDNGLQYAPMS